MPSEFSASLSSDDIEPWLWELPDGCSFDLPDAKLVTLRFTGRGLSRAESEAHLVVIEGEHYWFTTCQ